VTTRIHIAIRGAVQGVGFRPFIYRLATFHRLAGWVLNGPQGVEIEAEGDHEQIEAFLLRIEPEKPPIAFIQSLEPSFIDPRGESTFVIRESATTGERTALVLPDIATCPACLRDIFDPLNRRYLYPFTNCTHCGPRFTIIESLPYDRQKTSMRGFPMCPDCRSEFDDPGNRRFHAQPTACPSCGPHLEAWGPEGEVLHRRHEGLLSAVRCLREGKIVALKGIGGFQLLVDARNAAAIRALRFRKRREEKPFALMAPDLAWTRALCELSPLEERLLRSPESPIVILRRRDEVDGIWKIEDALIAPGNPFLGVMLPYSPLHHLLLREAGFPVIATSGNLSDETMCTDEQEALERLHGIADLFLVHDRPIVRHADDSIVRVLLGRELVTRRARGYAPLPVAVEGAEEQLLAVGAHMKNTVAVSKRGNAFLSQHIGDLETRQSLEAFHRAAADMQELFEIHPASVVSDLHPDYLSTRFARATGMTVLTVQHHHAHIAACMADNGISGTVLGVSWDGTGLGTDGTVWGGEFLLTDGGSFSRPATFRAFRLPGGEVAAHEPRRSGLGLLFEMFGSPVFERNDLHPVRAFLPAELRVLRTMLERGIRAPRTTSAGRLFDAVAAITGLRTVSAFEGQSAMELEFALAPGTSTEPYIISARDADDPRAGQDHRPRFILDWAPMIEAVLRDVGAAVPVALISWKFHAALAEAIVEIARRVGESRVVLSGGCFQNRFLTERAVLKLREAGFHPYWHQRVPPNDGGIALGQIAVASALRQRKEKLP
jgi:hydrogenase maturation protein HypF